MHRLVAYIGNDPEHLECAIYPARQALQMPSHRQAAGWGLGFVQSGDVLLQKRLRTEASEVDFFGLTRDLRADAFLGRAAIDTEGRWRAEDSDPFRFRFWLFGAAGDFGGFGEVRHRLLESVPDFLRRNIRGQSPSEHVFHLFLAFMHDAGLLDSLSAQPEPAQRALSESAAFLDRLLAGVGAASTRLAVVTTNGRCLVALSHGQPVQYLSIDGVPSCEVCRAKRSDRPTERRISHEYLRATILESDGSAPRRAGWRQVPSGGALLVGPEGIVHTI